MQLYKAQISIFIYQMKVYIVCQTVQINFPHLYLSLSQALFRPLAHSQIVGRPPRAAALLSPWTAVEGSYLGRSRGKRGSVFPLELVTAAVTASDLPLSCIFIISRTGNQLWK